MIIFDTETTGLIQNEALGLEAQPRILEVGLLRVNDKLEVTEEYSALVLPPGYIITDEIANITKLTQEELVAGGREFPMILPRLVNFFIGEDTMMGHNVNFDVMMLVFELRRIGWEHRFPYPRVQLDTRELWPNSLAKWGVHHKYPTAQTHRALDDCRLLLHCYKQHIAETGHDWTY